MQFRLWRAAAFVSSPIHLLHLVHHVFRFLMAVISIYPDHPPVSPCRHLGTTSKSKMSHSTWDAGPRTIVCTAVKGASGRVLIETGRALCWLVAGMFGGHGMCPAASEPSRRGRSTVTVLSRSWRCRPPTTPSITSHHRFIDDVLILCQHHHHLRRSLCAWLLQLRVKL